MNCSFYHTRMLWPFSIHVIFLLAWDIITERWRPVLCLFFPGLSDWMALCQLVKLLSLNIRVCGICVERGLNAGRHLLLRDLLSRHPSSLLLLLFSLMHFHSVLVCNISPLGSMGGFVSTRAIWVPLLSPTKNKEKCPLSTETQLIMDLI